MEVALEKELRGAGVIAQQLVGHLPGTRPTWDIWFPASHMILEPATSGFWAQRQDQKWSFHPQKSWKDYSLHRSFFSSRAPPSLCLEDLISLSLFTVKSRIYWHKLGESQAINPFLFFSFFFIFLPDIWLFVSLCRNKIDMGWFGGRGGTSVVDYVPI